MSNPRFEASSGKKIPEDSNLKGQELKTALNQGVSDHKETAKQEQPKCSVQSQANNQSNKKRKPASLKQGAKIEISNRFEWLSSEDESDATHLKRQKSKCDDEVSLAGNRENERARKKALRENQSEEEKDRIKEKDRLRKKAARAAQSEEKRAKLKNEKKRIFLKRIKP